MDLGKNFGETANFHRAFTLEERTDLGKVLILRDLLLGEH